MFSTLSFSGSALFSKLNRGFDVVIIDEAAQAVRYIIDCEIWILVSFTFTQLMLLLVDILLLSCFLFFI